VVTDDEVYQRLDELERLLWRRVFGGLRKMAPGVAGLRGLPRRFLLSRRRAWQQAP
jgi:hypothetical protein